MPTTLRWLAPFISFCIAATGGPLWASPVDDSVVIALITDGPSREAWDLGDELMTELEDLTRGEIELQFIPFAGDWTQEGLEAAVERAWNDPAIEMVLVSGLVANQVLGTYDHYPKPTFLPLVADAELFGLPRAGTGSGQENLFYLSDEISFPVDLASLLELTPINKLALLVDQVLFDVVTRIRSEAGMMAAEADVELMVIPYSDPDGDLLALIPEHAEAVMIDGLARLDEAEVDGLIAGLIDRGLPSFAMMGPELVERGLLISNTQDSEYQRIARRNALAMQAVMLGESAAEQPVEFDAKRRLLVNLETAQQIDVWPSYRLLVEAKLIGGDIGRGAPTMTLAEAAREALRANLSLLAETFGVDAGAEDIRTARAAFLPQITAGLSGVRLNSDSAAVSSGSVADTSLSGSVTVSQLVFSEDARANLAIQRSLQDSRVAELDAFRLDTVQAATLAFLEVLRAETQFRIQRDNLDRTQTNLELARGRVSVGAANAADAYRWESELASARQAAINAHAQRMRARENLNRVLNRTIDEPLDLSPPSLDDGEIFTSSDELEALIDNPKGFRLMTEILVQQGLDQAPELRSIEAAIAAKERELAALRRAFFLPTVALQGELSEVLAESTRAAGFPSLEGETDWSLGLSATLPLWEGGARTARRDKAALELQQLRATFDASLESIEQNIRSNMHLANASYASIELAEEGAEWANKNLELVEDLYAEGAVDITQLLDAQSAAVQADEAASNAVFNFLVDLMNANRAVGHFDLFLGPTQRLKLLEEMTKQLSQGS
ncbi:MAG: TolC family protein [Acidobacteriota bacterium]